MFYIRVINNIKILITCGNCDYLKKIIYDYINLKTFLNIYLSIKKNKSSKTNIQ